MILTGSTVLLIKNKAEKELNRARVKEDTLPSILSSPSASDAAHCLVLNYQPIMMIKRIVWVLLSSVSLQSLLAAFQINKSNLLESE